MKKEAPYDLISIKQLTYGMLTALTRLPIPHNTNSKDSGAGKSYLLNLVSGYIPQKYVVSLAGMSDKAILHLNGTMVIEKQILDNIQGNGNGFDNNNNKNNDTSSNNNNGIASY